MDLYTATKICGGIALSSLFLFVLAFTISIIMQIKKKQYTYQFFRWSFEGWSAFLAGLLTVIIILLLIVILLILSSYFKNSKIGTHIIAYVFLFFGSMLMSALAVAKFRLYKFQKLYWAIVIGFYIILLFIYFILT